jgi:acid phosphatase
MQTSAEYRAAALAVYANARKALDASFDNPFTKAALEETVNDPGQPPAVILDLDETVLDNGAFETRAIRAHKTYDSKMWKEWTAEGAARAVPGAAEFLAYAQSRGVTPFYITNRDVDEEAGTRRNLVQLGLPLDPKIDTLLMQGKNGWTTSDKSPRRAHVASTHRILLMVGDDLNDFAPASGKTVEERNAIVESVRNWWGEVWFILPNPMYGSWERAAVSGGGTPCEQVQKKVDALRDK